MPVRCPGCGRATTPGPRCPDCERAFQAKRNSEPKRAAYRDPLYKSIPIVGVCEDCGAMTDLTRHHVKRVRDGGTVFDGIVILCRACNSRRG